MGKVIGYSVLGVILFAIISVVSLCIGYYNTGVQYDAKLAAVFDENKVVLNTYTTKVQEVAQVPDMYKDGLKEVVKATFEGRYGKDGSKAVMQWIQEQNIQFDSSMYKQIQQVIESGRNDFQTSQKILVDTKRVYETELKSFPGVMFYSILGFPKVSLETYKIVTLGSVNAKFESGQDEVIKLKN